MFDDDFDSTEEVGPAPDRLSMSMEAPLFDDFSEDSEKPLFEDFSEDGGLGLFDDTVNETKSDSLVTSIFSFYLTDNLDKHDWS